MKMKQKTIIYYEYFSINMRRKIFKEDYYAGYL